MILQLGWDTDQMEYGKHMNDLQEICSQVWATKDPKAKRNLLKRAVASFKYKEKADRFVQSIVKAKDDQLDFIASNLILNKTDKVVDLLPQ